MEIYAGLSPKVSLKLGRQVGLERDTMREVLRAPEKIPTLRAALPDSAILEDPGSSAGLKPQEIKAFMALVTKGWISAEDQGHVREALVRCVFPFCESRPSVDDRKVLSFAVLFLEQAMQRKILVRTDSPQKALLAFLANCLAKIYEKLAFENHQYLRHASRQADDTNPHRLRDPREHVTLDLDRSLFQSLLREARAALLAAPREGNDPPSALACLAGYRDVFLNSHRLLEQELQPIDNLNPAGLYAFKTLLMALDRLDGRYWTFDPERNVFEIDSARRSERLPIHRFRHDLSCPIGDLRPNAFHFIPRHMPIMEVVAFLLWQSEWSGY